jgi:hypothetical protein
MREPEGVPVIRWRCANDGCRKSYADRRRARKHAERCPRDPDNAACLTCANFSDGFMDEPPYCEVGLEVGGLYGNGDPMPRNCPSWAAPLPKEGEQ